MEINRLIENSMADVGIDYISDTEVHATTAPTVFVGLFVTEEVIIEAITVENNSGNTLVGATIPVGAWPFRFTSIKLTSGKAIAVKGV